MTEHQPESAKSDDLRAMVVQLSERLERVEARLGIEPVKQKEATVEPIPERSVARAREEQENFEFAVGQTWFALIGIIVLSIGMAFLLSLPFPSLPNVLPSAAGYVVCGLVFLLARISRKSFADISKYLRGAGMLLLFFATWRLFDFGAEAALSTESITGRGLVLAVVVVNLVLAWRRASPVLFVFAVITGLAGALMLRNGWIMLSASTFLVLISCLAQLKRDWRGLTPVVFVLAFGSYVLWAVGNPMPGDGFTRYSHFYPMVWTIPVWIVMISVTVMLRENREVEDTSVQVSAVLLSAFGMSAFFVHHLLVFGNAFLAAHLVLAVLLLVLSVVFWVREQSRFSTFIYAMTGYMALSLALIDAFDSPEVFVALSLQSLVVIATAIYFCSPFIIVANCLIFIGIMGGYLVVAEAEQGMSIGFGVVALVSARILNWQKERLTLKTELMRNTYLTIAFIAFPYALNYLVPETYVAVAWVGLALFYYGLHLFFGNRKYRWMGHATLLLTALYVMVIGTARLESHYRIITFLILGSIMLVVSLVFTLLMAKRKNQRLDKEDDS